MLSIASKAAREPEYFGFHPETLEFAGFRLIEDRYQPIEPTTGGRLWSQQLELCLGVRESKLRFCLPEESAEREIEALRSQLKALGIDPELRLSTKQREGEASHTPEINRGHDRCV